MKLSRLLELNTQNAEASTLPNNLGDAYLYKNNRIFRSIRETILSNGYSFSDDFNQEYLALPLSQLEDILQSKKIPYFNNVNVLIKLEQKNPQLTTWEDIQDNLKRNFVFHESCHACARVVASKNRTSDQNKILNLLLEESFANTCELLAVIDVQDAAHRIFYEINSYTALYQNQTQLKNAINDLGIRYVSKIILLGYLHSNHLHNFVTDKDLKRILKLANLEANKSLNEKELKTIKFLIKFCFNLDETFKLVTTRFYMKLNRVGLEHADLQSSDYLSILEKQPEYVAYLNSMVDVISC